MNAPLASRRDRLKQLRAFCEAARRGSFAGAALAIESSPSVVSHQVGSLEHDLGAALFARRGAGLVLTRIGEGLYRTAAPLVRAMLRLPEVFEEEHHGAGPQRLRIGAGEISGAWLLPGLLRRYRERHRAVRIEVRTGAGAERLRWLREHELDLVAAALDAVPRDVAFRAFHVSEIVLAVAADHPLAGRDRVALEEALRYPLVAPPSERPARRLQDAALRLRGAAARVVLEVDGWGATLNHVAAGTGVALVPDVCAAASRRVRMVRLSDAVVRRTYGLATRRDRLAGAAVAHFVELVAPGADEAR